MWRLNYHEDFAASFDSSMLHAGVSRDCCNIIYVLFSVSTLSSMRNWKVYVHVSTDKCVNWDLRTSTCTNSKLESCKWNCKCMWKPIYSLWVYCTVYTLFVATDNHLWPYDWYEYNITMFCTWTCDGCTYLCCVLKLSWRTWPFLLTPLVRIIQIKWRKITDANNPKRVLYFNRVIRM